MNGLAFLCGRNSNSGGGNRNNAEAVVRGLLRRTRRRATSRATLEILFDRLVLAPFGWQIQELLDEAYENGLEERPEVEEAEALEVLIEELRRRISEPEELEWETNGKEKVVPSLLRTALFGWWFEKPPPTAPVLARPRRSKRENEMENSSDMASTATSESERIKGDPNYGDGAVFS